MKILLSCLLFLCFLISAKAQSLAPSTVLKRDGVLRISDDSTYYEFNTNGTFQAFPISWSGRTFTGTWTSSTNGDVCIFTVMAKIGWKGFGFVPNPDDYNIVFDVYDGTRRPADKLHPATFQCYWIVDELTKLSKPDK